MSAQEYTRPTSPTRFFVASAIWAAVIIPLAWLSSTFLSIPGAFGAGYFWLPNMAMPIGAYFFGPWGWLAAAVGTFLGGMIAGSPFLINFAQNPVPAFLANAMLFWLIMKLFKVNVGSGMEQRKERSLNSIIMVGLATVVLAVVLGYLIGRATDALQMVFLLTIPAWFVLGVPLNRHVIIALVAIILSSVISAAIGAYAWATIGEMGASAWAIVFPGWALGDMVAGSLAVPLIWTLNATMKERGLDWNR
jgi:hypothetical protein